MGFGQLLLRILERTDILRGEKLGEEERSDCSSLFSNSELLFFLDLRDMLFNGLHFIPQIFQMLL
jgi:hypothetical protein